MTEQPTRAELAGVVKAAERAYYDVLSKARTTPRRWRECADAAEAFAAAYETAFRQLEEADALDNAMTIAIAALRQKAKGYRELADCLDEQGGQP